MTRLEAGSLAFTLAGVYALIRLAVALGNFAVVFAPHTPESIDLRVAALLVVGPLAGLAILGVVLIRGSHRLAGMIFLEPDAPVATSMTSADLLAVLLAVLGIWMIASALPDVSLLFYLRELPGREERTALDSFLLIVPQIMHLIFSIGIGLALLLGRLGISDVADRLRRGRRN